MSTEKVPDLPEGQADPQLTDEPDTNTPPSYTSEKGGAPVAAPSYPPPPTQPDYPTLTSQLPGPLQGLSPSDPDTIVLLPFPDKVNDWQSGLCGCFNNCGLCVVVYFCPCYTLGKNAEALGESCLLFGLLSVIPIGMLALHLYLRGKIRDRQGIKGSGVNDCCLTYWCRPCSLAQETTEIRHMTSQNME